MRISLEGYDKRIGLLHLLDFFSDNRVNPIFKDIFQSKKFFFSKKNTTFNFLTFIYMNTLTNWVIKKKASISHETITRRQWQKNLMRSQSV